MSKPRKTPEEISEIRRRCALMRKTKPAGRPKGAKSLTPEEREARRLARKRTKEELSAIRRRASMMVKNRRGGRKPGQPNGDTGKFCPMTEPRISVQMLVRDKDVFVRCAKADGISLVKFLNKIAELLKASGRYGSLFTTTDGE